MLKRTFSAIFLATVRNNRRLYSSTVRQSNNFPKRHEDSNTQHRPFKRISPRSFSQKKENETLDATAPQFNSYNATRIRPRISTSNRRVLPQVDEDDNELFSEEKDDLTMLGSDKKAFSSSLSNTSRNPKETAISLAKRTENLNVPLEVLIQPDLRDLYSDEGIHQSLELYITEMRPALRPFTFDLAYLINESPTLQRFIEMGVDIYRWNQPNAKAKYILTLDFERDCTQHLVFLTELGIKGVRLAEFLSYNPWIFKETLDDLRTRINYLESKHFNRETIRDIAIRAPFLLNLSTKSIDTKLAWFQKKFTLIDSEIRDFVIRAPKLVTLPLQDISNTYFNMQSYLGFEPVELKSLFLAYPKLFIYDYKLIELNFDFLFNEMGIKRWRLLDYPPVLKQSFQQLRTRCLYLKSLRRDQFDPSKPNFVSLKALCVKTNDLFCQTVAKMPVQHYLQFMKTL